MGRRRIKVKKWKVNDQGKITGRHYDYIVEDDLVAPASVANNAQWTHWWARDQLLTFSVLQQTLQKLQQITFDPELRAKLTKEEMAKQVELYKNVIEAKYGVKLCVSQNMDSDMTQMLLLVPNELFADDKGREGLADALQNIAMFILNMENPSDF